MRTMAGVSVDDVLPSVSAVLEAQDIPLVRHNDERLRMLALQSIALYREKAQPTGIFQDITKEEFKLVFVGEGNNDANSPVGPISLGSDFLALFAVTLGDQISKEISRLFRTNDFALGSMLDTAASEGTEMAAQMVENQYRRHLKETEADVPGNGVLRFSPGYCGWHLSAQKVLFGSLHPGDIGIGLSDSCLMLPLKSISGVIISGKKDIFNFDDTFSFCRDCATHTCRERIASLMDQ